MSKLAICCAGSLLVAFASSAFLLPFAAADTGVNKATQNDKAFAKYGLTGKGVIVAILDRGLDYSNLSPATDALGIATVIASGDFHVSGNTCKATLAAGSSCVIQVNFKPTATGARPGTLTIKDFNTNSPHLVSLSGTGQ